MSGCKSGVVTRLCAAEPRAVFTHCYGHALNLACGDTIKQSKLMLDALNELVSECQLPECQLPKYQLPKCRFPKCQLFKILKQHIQSIHVYGWDRQSQPLLQLSFLLQPPLFLLWIQLNQAHSYVLLSNSLQLVLNSCSLGDTYPGTTLPIFPSIISFDILGVDILEVDILGVGISGVDILGVDILGVAILGVNILGGTLFVHVYAG